MITVLYLYVDSLRLGCRNGFSGIQECTQRCVYSTRYVFLPVSSTLSMPRKCWWEWRVYRSCLFLYRFTNKYERRRDEGSDSSTTFNSPPHRVHSIYMFLLLSLLGPEIWNELFYERKVFSIIFDFSKYSSKLPTQNPLKLNLTNTIRQFRWLILFYLFNFIN